MKIFVKGEYADMNENMKYNSWRFSIDLLKFRLLSAFILSSILYYIYLCHKDFACMKSVEFY